jgi:hypothetical protein
LSRIQVFEVELVEVWLVEPLEQEQGEASLSGGAGTVMDRCVGTGGNVGGSAEDLQLRTL